MTRKTKSFRCPRQRLPLGQKRGQTIHQYLDNDNQKSEAASMSKQAKSIAAFANEAHAISIGGLSIENRTDCISIYGSIDITRDQAGLAHAEPYFHPDSSGGSVSENQFIKR